MTITLDIAFRIIAEARGHAKSLGLRPLTIAVLDAGGHVKALAREDGSSNMRAKIAEGKARGALAMGLGSRALYERAEQQPYFIQSMNALAEGSLVPVPGGVLVRENHTIVGAVGITGDSSDNDEICAVKAIQSLGYKADTG